MVYAWCKNCCRHRRLEQTELGFVCCTGCGSVVEDSIYSEEPTFVKDSSGLSRVSGNYVNTIQSENGVSRQRTLEKARDFINHMIQHLGVGGGDYIAQPAVRFYEIAIEKNFLRGRKFMPVAAACLYIVCRENNKPFLLIEFSEFLRVNVYVLGAVFLQLCKVLHLQEHPIVQKPVDPSLFIHRFTRGLLGEVNHEVEKTALRIMASMKLNWMQTGRKPSGLCGAALYISALSHGFKYSKTDIVKAVHICEATLTKRLIEFEGTESGGLTIEEFNEKAEELERNYKTAKDDNCRGTVSEVEDLLCEHKGSGQSHFAHGLCVTCYHEFIKISGGLDGGLEPPAFQRAERERLEMMCANKMDGDSLLEPSLNENSCKNLNTKKDTGHGAGRVDHTIEGVNAQCEAVNGIDEETVKADDLGIESDNESENFSDIDDIEVATYLHNEEEKRYKKIIWEHMNREYLEEQAAKEAEAAAREAMMAKNGSSQVPDAVKQLYDEASANYAKLKRGRQQKRAAEAKNPQTAAEAAHQMLSKKRISSKLNHDRLKELFDEPVIPDNLKRSRTEAELEKNAVSQTSKSEVEGENDEDELETVDEIEAEGDYQGDTYHDDYEEYADFDEGFL